MSAPINDGGPAFPAQPMHKFPDGAIISLNQGGMTLRDYFAGQALAGVVPGIEHEVDKIDPDSKYYDQSSDQLHQCAAIRAYCYADAMLAAREAKP